MQAKHAAEQASINATVHANIVNNENYYKENVLLNVD